MDVYKTHGAFSWAELMTPDPKAAIATYRHLVDVHLPLVTLGCEQGDTTRGEVQQLADRVAGAVLGELLERLRDRVQERQRRRLGPRAERTGDDRCDGHQQLDADGTLTDELLERLRSEEAGADDCGSHEQRRRDSVRGSEGSGEVASRDQQTAESGPAHLPRAPQVAEETAPLALGLKGCDRGRCRAHRGAR